MKNIAALLLFLSGTAMCAAQTSSTLYVTTGAQTLTATLADNDATERLKELLADGPVTVTMNDYGGFEKVGALPWNLPAADSQLTARAGDIMLYLGRNIVFFYGSNSWAYTRLGRFDTADPDDLKSFLSGSNLSVELSLSPRSEIKDASADADTAPAEAFDLSGRRINPGSRPKEIYIVNGKKQIKK